jgi:hypothetical protein
MIKIDIYLAKTIAPSQNENGEVFDLMIYGYCNFQYATIMSQCKDNVRSEIAVQFEMADDGNSQMGNRTVQLHSTCIHPCGRVQFECSAVFLRSFTPLVSAECTRARHCGSQRLAMSIRTYGSQIRGHPGNPVRLNFESATI